VFDGASHDRCVLYFRDSLSKWRYGRARTIVESRFWLLLDALSVYQHYVGEIVPEKGVIEVDMDGFRIQTNRSDPEAMA
jgi:hypothetical protein